MKLVLMLVTVAVLSSCSMISTDMPNSDIKTDAVIEVEENISEPELTEVNFSENSKSEGMTEVKNFSYDLSGDKSLDEITLYTSAMKEEGYFIWDDGADFLLEIKDSEGKIYTLFDGRVSLGNVYFDIVVYGEDKFVVVRNISTASDYAEVFTVRDGKVYKTDELDMNNLKEMDTNLIYTSVPMY